MNVAQDSKAPDLQGKSVDDFSSLSGAALLLDCKSW